MSHLFHLFLRHCVRKDVKNIRSSRGGEEGGEKEGRERSSRYEIIRMRVQKEARSTLRDAGRQEIREACTANEKRRGRRSGAPPPGAQLPDGSFI